MLGGKVRLLQPRDGYRAGTDPVVLAAAVAAVPGQSVLELGCGAGPGLCCLGIRVPGLRLTGLELQPGYAALARQNLTLNKLEGEIWTGNLSEPPPQLRAQSFDHVFANPPYFEAGKRIEAEESGREIALAGDTPLTDWVTCAAKRLKPKGYATFIQRAERLPDLLVAMQGRLGAIELFPLLPRLGRAPRLVLVRGRKEGRAPFRFHAGAVIHSGDRHEEPGNRYTDRFEAIMMRGAALEFPASVK
ncbi:methyltransferase [Mameliella alba]|nr:methyltransferase [Mameliella sediminis]MBY6113403.1 methyltransferase [Antarctobacter heliothermus]MBY6143249.1 methyltransferase [Mameliella alba]MBY6163150.1 methyltransferase [Mameliella alba]MBY6171414.1 methyltransferase [Mameliella alba]